MKLREYDQYKEFLSYEGIYEIGHIRGVDFFPKYIGKSWDLFKRMQSYNNKNAKNNKEVIRRLRGKYDNLWFHVIRVTDSEWSESKLLSHHGKGEFGLYEYNIKPERVSAKRGKLR